MDASDFAATVIRRQHELVVELKGELDAASGPTLTTAIADIEHDDARRVVLDLGALSFLDAGGLSALLQSRQRLAERGMTMRVAGVQPSVSRLLRITGLDALLLDGQSAEDVGQLGTRGARTARLNASDPSRLANASPSS
jgi:anti-anti-sigma factor